MERVLTRGEVGQFGGPGVNFPDIRERMGVYQRTETHVGGVALPRVSGLQAVGRVVEVGAKCDHSLIGKKVVALLRQADKRGRLMFRGLRAAPWHLSGLQCQSPQ